MKVASHQVERMLNDTSQLAGILFYGEDLGQIRDHMAVATRGVIGATVDPFRSCVLTREEHGRLRDEVGSLALGGGRRVVRVQEATDGLAQSLERLSEHRADALILVEGAGLAARSKLRMMAEKHPHWAAIACYGESGAALSASIRRSLTATGLTVEESALVFLAAELAGDSTRRRAELEKLGLYAAGDGVVTLETAQACCAVSVDASLAQAVQAAMQGRPDLCDCLLEELSRDGATGPGILAVLANQVHRVLKVRLSMDEGRSAEEACRGLFPPIFPRQMPGFLREVQRWPVMRLEALGRAVREADIACKRAASPDFAIAARLLGAVAGVAPVGRMNDRRDHL